MGKLGLHFSHEQFAPSILLTLAKRAEAIGFSLGLSSDHFHPWNTAQAHSGFAWSWLGAALSHTRLSFGIVNCPTFRYHPAIIAQAAATLDEMFPGRFWLAVGSGQALNEAILGEHWPAKAERNARLKEAVEIIRALWKGEKVSHHGRIHVEEAVLYTRPRKPILLVGAAITPATAGWAASWADALITTSQPLKQLEQVVHAWKEKGGEHKPMILKVQLSYGRTMEEARQGAFEQWKTNVFGSSMQAELRSPEQFEQAALHVKPEDLHDHVNISNEPEQHSEWIDQYKAMGFHDVVLHNVNSHQEQFLEECASRILERWPVS
jgi:coenzyme F420-dependent glucose-6-phosphate dehydrogenase